MASRMGLKTRGHGLFFGRCYESLLSVEMARCIDMFLIPSRFLTSRFERIFNYGFESRRLAQLNPLQLDALKNERNDKAE